MSWLKFIEEILPQIQLLPQQCAVCGKLILGQAARNLWGDTYCLHHQNEHPICDCCGRLISPGMTGGGVTYDDGRQVCTICRRTAVDTKEQAKPILDSVCRWLYDRGVRFKGLVLKVDLVNTRELQQRSGGKGAGKGIAPGVILQADLGVIARATTPGPGGASRRQVNGVALLEGLPRELFEGVAAHELGHAWLFLAGVDNLEPWAEEGFCNLLSYVLHKDCQTDEARFWVKTLEANPDPVYGEGFRRVRTIFKKHGFIESLRYLHQHKHLPPA